MNQEEKNKMTFEQLDNGQKRTSTGLEQNVAGLLCYMLGFVTGIIFLLIEKDNRFVRFHAWQSTIMFGGLFVANLILTTIPFIGWLFSIILVPVTLIVWIVMMMKAYQGQMMKLPIVGDIAEKQVVKS